MNPGDSRNPGAQLDGDTLMLDPDPDGMMIDTTDIDVDRDIEMLDYDETLIDPDPGVEMMDADLEWLIQYDVVDNDVMDCDDQDDEQ